jgi:hypothetical protein
MTNLQIAGAVHVEIECNPNWSDCQKEQARAKAADLDHQCKKAPLTRDPNYGAVTEQAKTRAQAAWNERFYAVRAGEDIYGHPELGTNPNNYPSGLPEDFTHPCMEQEMVNGGPPTRQRNGRTISNWCADHRTECIAGGSTQGPMKMLDYKVNSAFGGSMKAAVNMGPVHSVKLVGC